jgi:hypothetical protein
VLKQKNLQTNLQNKPFVEVILFVCSGKMANSCPNAAKDVAYMTGLAEISRVENDPNLQMDKAIIWHSMIDMLLEPEYVRLHNAYSHLLDKALAPKEIEAVRNVMTWGIVDKRCVRQVAAALPSGPVLSLFSGTACFEMVLELELSRAAKKYKALKFKCTDIQPPEVQVVTVEQMNAEDAASLAPEDEVSTLIVAFPPDGPTFPAALATFTQRCASGSAFVFWSDSTPNEAQAMLDKAFDMTLEVEPERHWPGVDDVVRVYIKK